MISPVVTPRLRSLRRVLLIFICVWFALVVFVSNEMANRFQADSPPSLPFGVFVLNGATYTKDFSYNMLYLHGIQARLVARPYRLAEQEKLIRQLLPTSSSGMSHAYSPVAFVLAQPLLDCSGRTAYAIYTAVCALVTLLLFHYYLFPRTADLPQLGALAVSAMSVWVATTFTVGQTSPITTAAMAAFWALLSRREEAATFLRDTEIGALFYILCLKPSVAIMPVALLIGLKAWRPFLLGLLLLAFTWSGVSSYYGGFWTGLGDYLHLLDHYNNAAFTPFMQRAPETAQQMQFTSWSFAIERNLVLLASLVLTVLRWMRLISGSGLFQGVGWTFLVLSPYLMPTENWVLWLLVVEGTFFVTRGSPLGYVKLALVIAIFQLRAHVTFPITVDWWLKLVLAGWCLAESYFAPRIARS